MKTVSITGKGHTHTGIKTPKKLYTPLELLELVMYGNENDGTKDQAYEDLKQSLTPPTQEEVCKHLNESFALNRHNTTLHFIYDSESREFRMVDENNKVYRYISTIRLTDKAIELIDLDIDDLIILGRFYEGEMKDEWKKIRNHKW